MINVALGLIIENNKILIMQRVREPYKDYWELPGGKIEPDESPEEALVRELKEELDIEVSINNLKYFDNYAVRHSREGGNPEYSVNLNIFEIKQYNKKIKNNLGQNLAWINKNNYKNYQILPVTVDIVSIFLAS